MDSLAPSVGNRLRQSLETMTLTERRLRAIERRIELRLQAGRPADVIPELRRLTAENPLRERLWAQLMTALAGCDRIAS